ncbi:uncharacterized protein LY89DRAFT_772575 [Mollisia scopiformis]|uniref:Uncharacterized protein n=1 Tax=Mollisia scopiformis TaxID=149040 RepID=A0A194XIE3_MOLSC|nr:uncharacterized protein LY89DRAFT_772575 [Mollisia scopiformis]KUJ19928.1 hypothetical protein LY89DRAFT_772575 [Mollisia scopiformis]
MNIAHTKIYNNTPNSTLNTTQLSTQHLNIPIFTNTNKTTITLAIKMEAFNNSNTGASVTPKSTFDIDSFRTHMHKSHSSSTCGGNCHDTIETCTYKATDVLLASPKALTDEGDFDIEFFKFRHADRCGFREAEEYFAKATAAAALEQQYGGLYQIAQFNNNAKNNTTNNYPTGSSPIINQPFPSFNESEPAQQFETAQQIENSTIYNQGVVPIWYALLPPQQIGNLLNNSNLLGNPKTSLANESSLQGSCISTPIPSWIFQQFSVNSSTVRVCEFALSLCKYTRTHHHIPDISCFCLVITPLSIFYSVAAADLLSRQRKDNKASRAQEVDDFFWANTSIYEIPGKTWVPWAPEHHFAHQNRTITSHFDFVEGLKRVAKEDLKSRDLDTKFPRLQRIQDMMNLLRGNPVTTGLTASQLASWKFKVNKNYEVVEEHTFDKDGLLRIPEFLYNKSELKVASNKKEASRKKLLAFYDKHKDCLTGCMRAPITTLEDSYLLLVAAHVAPDGKHRGRDATMEYLRGGLSENITKETLWMFITACPTCEATTNKRKRDDDDPATSSSKRTKAHPVAQPPVEQFDQTFQQPLGQVTDTVPVPGPEQSYHSFEQQLREVTDTLPYVPEPEQVYQTFEQLLGEATDTPFNLPDLEPFDETLQQPLGQVTDTFSDVPQQEEQIETFDFLTTNIDPPLYSSEEERQQRAYDIFSD